MAYYRLYHLEGAHFCGVAELDFDDDAQAVGQAGTLLVTGAAELWCGRRRVRIFGPDATGLGGECRPSAREPRLSRSRAG